MGRDARETPQSGNDQYHLGGNAAFPLKFNNRGGKCREIARRWCAEKQIKSRLHHNINNMRTKHVKGELEVLLKTKGAIYLIY